MTVQTDPMLTMNAAMPAPAMREIPAKAREHQRFVLDGISWQQYTTIGDALLDRPGLRMTYDRGRLEFMTTSPLHEIYNRRLARLLETLIEVFGKDMVTAGHMTFQREDLDRGLEPDDCFWIAHEPYMRPKTTWDPDIDPPPDLVLEIEISRSALNRMAIYAALRVPEVWRCDGETLHAELLQPDGTWVRSETSPTFPGILLNDIMPFLHPSETMSYLETMRAFRAWVEQQLSRSSS